MACLIFLFIIYLLAKNLSSEFDRGGKSEPALASLKPVRALFAGMMDVVFVMDADGRYVEIAPTNPANLYRPPDEMLGKTMHEILPKEPADTILSMIHSSIQTGQVVIGEYALPIDGKEIYFSASASRTFGNHRNRGGARHNQAKAGGAGTAGERRKVPDLFNNAEMGCSGRGWMVQRSWT